MQQVRVGKGKMSKEAGFTLIELMISLTIIVIIMAIAIPNYQKAGEKAQVSGCAGNQKIIMAQLESYYLSNSNYPTLAKDVLTDANLRANLGHEDFADFLAGLDLAETIAASTDKHLHVAYQALSAADQAGWYILDMAKLQDEGYLQDLVTCPKGGLYLMSLNDKGRLAKLMCSIDGDL